MHDFTNILRSYRLINLAIIAFTQFIVSYYIVQEFSWFIYFCIVSSTLCIALAGYFLNDVYDIEIDTLNNKLGLISKKNEKMYRIAAYILMFIGLSIGFYLSQATHIYIFYTYLGVVFSLVIYALYLSNYKIIGNVLVSALIAAVVLLCFYVETQHYTYTPKYYRYAEYQVWLYALLAFVVNWMREVVKDMEDIKGDEKNGRISLATLLNPNIIKLLLITLSLIFISLIALYIALNFDISLTSFLLTSLFVLFLICIVLLYSAKTSIDYRNTSHVLKLILIIGLCLPITF